MKAEKLQIIEGSTQHNILPDDPALPPVSRTTSERVKISQDVYEQDRWDIRKIKCAYTQISRRLNWVDFRVMPGPFRPSVKRFAEMLFGRTSADCTSLSIKYVAKFLSFYHDRHPLVTNLHELSRADIAQFRTLIMEPETPGGASRSQWRTQTFLSKVESYVRFLLQSYPAEAPRAPLSELFLKSDRTQATHKQRPISMPPYVQAQVEAHLSHLPPRAFVVLLLANETDWGWFDILDLRLAECLEEEDGQWWLCSEGVKTGARLRAPLETEIALFVDGYRRHVQEKHGCEYNPEGLLFGTYDTKARMVRCTDTSVNHPLRRFISKFNICDESGAPFSITMRLFRKTQMSQAFRGALASFQHKLSFPKPVTSATTSKATLRLVSGQDSDVRSAGPAGGSEQSASITLDPSQKFDLDKMFDGDVWDCRRLVFVQQQITKSQFFLRFGRIAAAFRPLVKRYIRHLLPHRALPTCAGHIFELERFFEFFITRRPDETSLASLTRPDMEAFVLWLRQSPMRSGKAASQRSVWTGVHAVRMFLLYVVRASEEGPTLSIDRLIWPEDATRKQWRNEAGTSVKFIPEHGVKQIDAQMHTLPPSIFPVVKLLRETGMRISDVLNLRTDTCLDRVNDRWWLRGDIPKVKKKNHRVPITDEVAEMVMRVRDETIREVGVEYNPHRFLFPARQNRRYGLPLSAYPIGKALKDWAVAHDIRDEHGNLIVLTTRAFRHTKATEWINQEVPLMVIQQLLGHSSSEMTMVYAYVLDRTIQKHFDRIHEEGLLHLDTNGDVAHIKPAEPQGDALIDWQYLRDHFTKIRLPDGYCLRNQKLSCEIQTAPCHTCPDFATTREFLPQLIKQKEDVLIQIEIASRDGHHRRAEKNANLLPALDKIISNLEQGNNHHAPGKAVREYTAEEWARKVSHVEKA